MRLEITFEQLRALRELEAVCWATGVWDDSRWVLGVEKICEVSGLRYEEHDLVVVETSNATSDA